MALNKTTLANAIQDDLWTRLDPGDPAKYPTKAQLRNLAESIANSVVDRIVGDLGIKGVKVNIDNGTLANAFTAAAVAPMDGGLVLKTNMAIATAGNYGEGVQKNNGTGLVE